MTYKFTNKETGDVTYGAATKVADGYKIFALENGENVHVDINAETSELTSDAYAIEALEQLAAPTEVVEEAPVAPTEEVTPEVITITESEAAEMEANAMTQEEAIVAGLDVKDIVENAVEVQVVPDAPTDEVMGADEVADKVSDDEVVA